VDQTLDQTPHLNRNGPITHRKYFKACLVLNFMKMIAVALFVVFYMLSGASCGSYVQQNQKTQGPIDPRIFFLSLPSNDIFKGLDPLTFAIQISDESHTKGFICPELSGNYKDEIDCRYFYMCSAGKVKHLKCLPGYAFNSSDGYCSPRKNVRSCYPAAPTIPATVSNTTVNGTTDKRENNTTTTTPTPSIDVLACTVDGAYANPKDCASYYICVYRKPIQFRCPQDTSFDTISKNCIPSDEAICLNSSNPNKKNNWIPNGFNGPRPHKLQSQQPKIFSFVAYHPST